MPWVSQPLSVMECTGRGIVTEPPWKVTSIQLPLGSSSDTSLRISSPSCRYCVRISVGSMPMMAAVSSPPP